MTDKELSKEKPVKYVIIPVSTVGCGKTEINICLNKLLPGSKIVKNSDYSHSSSFYSACVHALLLDGINVVILNKNNHRSFHRSQVLSAFQKALGDNYDIKYICLDYLSDTDQTSSNFKDIAKSSISRRSGKEGNISGNEYSDAKVASIIDHFTKDFQKLDISSETNESFDLVLKLKPFEPEYHNNLKKISKELNETYPDLLPSIPDDKKLEELLKDIFTNTNKEDQKNTK
ncbi:hypothetical protein WICMUC_005023 [Wickerhamomyces mucosus]|uniref:tRNA ligase kinase domain-containing protein n=1 Tax=Wickerhamomyces mucosus TaxID=1378264 RepID=A0A9P8T860_9ASCO|nr:hypothetical protein WICMUC_005023 [Wickerhamomyces mucosus]